MSKKIFACVFALIFIASLAPHAFALEIMYPTEYAPLETDSSVLQLNDGTNSSLSEEILQVKDDSATLAENLNVAGSAYDSMMRSFYEAQPDSQKNKAGVYSVGGITADGFPEPYAGAYINQNQNLVVLMTESETTSSHSIAAGQETITQAADSKEIIFSTATYSYNYLVSIMDDIYQYIETGRNGEDGFYICHYSLDDYNNCVLVGLESDTEESRAAFHVVISDSDAVSFEPATLSSYEQAFSLTPGWALSTGSIGFRARKYENGSYTYGFLTAAHCYGPGETVYDDTTGYTIYGTASDDLWQMSGNLDAVFVESGWDFGLEINSTDGEILKSGIDANLAQGHPVSKSGKASGNTSGVVKYISRGFTYEGISYYDFGVTDCLARHGDSGGIFYSTRTGNNWIVGITNGIYTQPGESTSYTYFCKAINITTSFNLSLY